MVGWIAKILKKKIYEKIYGWVGRIKKMIKKQMDGWMAKNI